MKRYIICLVVLLSTGCIHDRKFTDTISNPPSSNINGDRVMLQLGDIKSIEEDDLSVELLDIPEDRRCPREVTCKWGGYAVVLIKLSKPSYESTILKLHTKTSVPRYNTKDEYLEYIIELISLNPYPWNETRIPKEDYKLILSVQSK